MRLFLDCLTKKNWLTESLDLYRHYKKLNHPELAKQLYPLHMRSSKRNRSSTCCDRHSPEVCHQKGTLEDDLLGIALNPQESLNIRVEAVRALAEIADTQVRAKNSDLWRPMIAEKILMIIKRLGPLCDLAFEYTAEELFSALTPPKNDNFVGMYHRFLSDELIKKSSDPAISRRL